MEETIKIRLMEARDIAQIREIYRYYVDNTCITFEYELPSLEEFTQRMHGITRKYPCLVAELEEELAGYAYASAFKGRAAYDWAVETSIYVRNGLYGKGIGGCLYEELENCLRRQHILNVNACIAYPHEQSERFHEKLGYRTVAHFEKCGYKQGKWLDMIWMEKFLGEHPDRPEKVIPFPELLQREK